VAKYLSIKTRKSHSEKQNLKIPHNEQIDEFEPSENPLKMSVFKNMLFCDSPILKNNRN